MFVGDYNYQPLVQPIFKAVLPRLEALDIDQEIKECAITTVGKLFAHMGDELKNQLPVVLTLLRKRLDNEITRTPTLKVQSGPVTVIMGC
jgi:cullin-associated NEDD8-dissociated protein 1